MRSSIPAACRSISVVALLLVIGCVSGCAVPQPRGNGQLDYLQEPSTGRYYYRYLPESYARQSDAARAARRWPLVVTFHGMRPFDTAPAQALEWQQEADRFGFIVIAPELRAPDLFQQFPLTDVTPALKSDEEATIAIMREVFAGTRADSTAVLATGWSSGGYMAHYMLNRHPESFTCLGVRQANFSAGVLDSAMTPRSQDRPILMLNTENDFAICLRESAEGVTWYERHQYRSVAWVKLKYLGHERTPDIAADFFARVVGIEPLKPQDVLVQRHAIDGNAAGLALLSGRAGSSRRATASEGENRYAANTRSDGAVTPPRLSDGSRSPASPSKSGPTEQSSKRAADSAANRQESAPVGIWVSSILGVEPLLFNYAVECPADWLKTCDFLWTINGKTLGSGPRGVTTLSESGTYELGVLAVTADGKEYRASRQVRVLPRETVSAR